MLTKGIIIFAIGHENYFRMAEVLAASLIVNGAGDDSISICLICDSEKNLTYPKLFDQIMVVDQSKYMVEGKIVFNNLTTLVYDLSPYDITIKLDADIVWIPGQRVNSLFEDLKDVDITFENMGHGWGKEDTNSVWAEEDDLKEAYNLSEDQHRLYKIYGEFLYFKKTKDNRAFFKLVKDIYRKKKVKTRMKFANGEFTDELAFQVAIMQTRTYPHRDLYTPVYNVFLKIKDYKKKYPYELKDLGIYGYSIGGNTTDMFTKRQYENLASHYYSRLGLQNPYKVKDKRQYLPERKPR